MIFSGSISDIVKVLHGRSGLELEELAARLDVPVQAITDLENGSVDPGVWLARRIAASTGHDVGLQLWRRLEDDEERWIRLQLHLMVSRLLLATEVTHDANLTRENLGAPAYVLLGLLGAAREVLRSLLLLDSVGQSLLASSNLVRQIFEYVATAEWILEDPVPRTTNLYQATNRDLREMGRLDERWEAIHQQRRDLWASQGIPEDEFAQRLPQFADRLTGAMAEEGWYIRYRELSTHIHPSLFVVEDALHSGPPLRYRAEAHCLISWFGMAGCLVWVLALRLRAFGDDAGLAPLGYRGAMDEFVPIGVMLNKFTNGPGVEELRAAYAAQREQ